MRGPMFLSTWLILLGGLPVRGQIFDVTFNELSPGLALTQPVTDPLPLRRPTNVVLDFPDAGDTIEIVTEAGDLTDQPVLLDAIPGGISWGGFLTPDVHSSGRFEVSWDSLVVDAPVSGDPGPDVGIHVVTRRGNPGTPSQLRIESRWELRYTPGGSFEILDAEGLRPAGTYTSGRSDRFDLVFDLDSGIWDLAVNGEEWLDGFLLSPFEFGGVVFLTNGRDRTADPPPLAMDNLLVRETPEVTELPGDYNGDGLVEQSDLDLVLAHWGAPALPAPNGWSADPPTGVIDQPELDRTLVNWGAAANGVAAVPEPAAAGMALLLTCMLGRGRSGRSIVIGVVAAKGKGRSK